jgi:Cu+-exporting ATPase
VRQAREQKLVLHPVDQFESATGIGVRGQVAGKALALGNTTLMVQEQIDVAPLREAADRLREEGASVMYLGVDGTLVGVLAVADPVKESAPDAVNALKAAGVRLIMATGDGQRTAQAVASALHIEEVHGELRPADKSALVARLHREGRRVAMAGDGINDAPALAAADVGIAMGTGTDVAMSSAQVTLVRGDLRGIVRALQLSHATVANMKQNLAFAFAYNALGVPLAAGVLYPAFGWLLSPMVAALAMSLSSVSVVANALRLKAAAAPPALTPSRRSRSSLPPTDGDAR